MWQLLLINWPGFQAPAVPVVQQQWVDAPGLQGLSGAMVVKIHQRIAKVNFRALISDASEARSC
jgi:hypothetical protein